MEVKNQRKNDIWKFLGMREKNNKIKITREKGPASRAAEREGTAGKATEAACGAS